MSDPTAPLLSSVEARLIAAQLGHLTDETRRNADGIAAIGESLHVLTRLEENQSHIAEKLKEGSMRMSDHERRLQIVEQDLPGLRELRKWVIAGVLAGLGMVGASLFKLVVLDVPRLPVSTQYTPKP
jgi:hypothetical protein